MLRICKEIIRAGNPTGRCIRRSWGIYCQGGIRCGQDCAPVNRAVHLSRRNRIVCTGKQMQSGYSGRYGKVPFRQWSDPEFCVAGTHSVKTPEDNVVQFHAQHFCSFFDYGTVTAGGKCRSFEFFCYRF